jgi:hypothetical protein
MIRWQDGRRRAPDIRAISLWIAGLMLMWLGSVGMAVNGAIWNDVGHATLASHAVGGGGLLLIFGGAWLWRHA